jgi:hypothetical protein
MTILSRTQALLSVLGVAALVAACSSGAAVGEACTTEGDATECSDGATCAKNQAAVLECMQICTSKDECPTGTDCTGTTGPTKVCQ